MRWNEIEASESDPLLGGYEQTPRFYFVHSYHVCCNNSQESICTELFTTNDELLPFVVVKAIPVLGNVRFPGLYPVSKSSNAKVIVIGNGDGDLPIILGGQ